MSEYNSDLLIMKKLLILLSLGITTFITRPGYSQQEAQYSQYMFNPLVINPAYAGSREAVSAIALFRNQWIGIDGAPITHTLSVHTPYVKRKASLREKKISLENKKIGLAYHHIIDQIGPTRRSQFYFGGAYRIAVGSGKLSFGLRGGLENYKIEWGEITYQEQNDNVFIEGRKNDKRLIAKIDFGLYYYDKNFYLGGAIVNLNRPKLGFDYKDPGGDSTRFEEARLSQHFFVSTGYAYPINEYLVFRPSLMFKYVANAPLDIDMNVSFLINNLVWLGTSYRLGHGLNLMMEIVITDQIPPLSGVRMGYAYDITMQGLKNSRENKIRNSGTHEIFIGYDFEIFRTKVKCPRFF